MDTQTIVAGLVARRKIYFPFNKAWSAIHTASARNIIDGIARKSQHEIRCSCTYDAIKKIGKGLMCVSREAGRRDVRGARSADGLRQLKECAHHGLSSLDWR